VIRFNQSTSQLLFNFISLQCSIAYMSVNLLSLSCYFQSRVGPVQWLKPYTDEVLVELGQKGVKSLLAVPVR